jgi:hypothetical protein
MELAAEENRSDVHKDAAAAHPTRPMTRTSVIAAAQ